MRYLSFMMRALILLAPLVMAESAIARPIWGDIDVDINIGIPEIPCRSDECEDKDKKPKPRREEDWEDEDINIGLPEIPCPSDCDNGGSGDSVQDIVRLSNGYNVSFLKVEYSGRRSTWHYYVEELPVAQDLSNWVLELPLSCARVVSFSPKAEVVNPDPNARLTGVKWQPGGGFVEGRFSVTLEGSVTLGTTNVAVKGPDVRVGSLAGPICDY